MATEARQGIPRTGQTLEPALPVERPQSRATAVVRKTTTELEYPKLIAKNGVRFHQHHGSHQSAYKVSH